MYFPYYGGYFPYQGGISLYKIMRRGLLDDNSVSHYEAAELRQFVAKEFTMLRGMNSDVLQRIAIGGGVAPAGSNIAK